MPTAPIIRLCGVTRTYGALPALDEVDLDIEAGTLVAIVGASGSGKTTLLKTINRLVEPDSGEVLVEGRPIRDRDPPGLRRSIGYVFQGVGLFPHMTVAQNIAVTPRLLGWPPSETDARVAELIELVGLSPEFALRRPSTLSGGQAQRVGVARALAARPSILLMDEPFGALDPLTRDTLARACRQLHDQLGLTTVMVTHDIQEAALTADRIVVMAAGRVVADGPPGALISGHPDPRVAALMDMPRRQSERVHALIHGPPAMNGQIDAAWALLPDYLAQHVVLSAAALALGVALSLPLALLAAHNRHVRWPVLAIASLVQTVPGLALLALFYPLLLAISVLTERWFGLSVPALGFLPSLLALTLYSMLPVLRNGVAGLNGLDPAVLEAADGVGMTARQKLLLVEAPLAAPVVMAGVRTAAVWTIGAATLATTVGQTSLGNYIFAGLQTENWVFVLFGCVAAAVLALVVDQILGLVETGAARGDPKRMAAGLAALVVGAGVAAASIAQAPAATYVVGAKNFSEQFILAEIMQTRLEAAGATVRRKDGLGSAVAFRALAGGDVDVYVDYSGTLWTNVMARTDSPPREAMLAELTTWMKANHGVVVLGPLGFENAYALAMQRGRAEALGIATVADLSDKAASLRLGSDLEFLSRPEWAALKTAYGLSFRSERSYNPTFMYRALESGEADVISAFSSDGRIAAQDLVVLAEPKQAIPAYDAVILVSPRRASDARLRRALTPLVGAIPVDQMRAANLTVDRDADKRSPAQAAAELSRALRLD